MNMNTDDALLADWKYEVANDDTRLGFVQWANEHDQWANEPHPDLSPFQIMGAAVYDEQNNTLEAGTRSLAAFHAILSAVPADEDEDTSWDTDEVVRWLDNDPALYELARHLARTQIDLAGALASEVTWEHYNSDIYCNDVDWDYVAKHVQDEL